MNEIVVLWKYIRHPKIKEVNDFIQTESIVNVVPTKTNGIFMVFLGLTVCVCFCVRLRKFIVGEKNFISSGFILKSSDFKTLISLCYVQSADVCCRHYMK